MKIEKLSITQILEVSFETDDCALAPIYGIMGSRASNSLKTNIFHY